MSRVFDEIGIRIKSCNQCGPNLLEQQALGGVMLNSIFHRYAAVLSVAKILVISLTVLIAASCTRPAKFPKRVSVADVLDSLRCELLEAVQKHASSDPWFLEWTASYSLSLTVDRNAGASTNNSTYVVPVSLGTFTLGLTANLNAQSFQLMAIEGGIDKLKNFAGYFCPRYEPGYRGRLLAGDLGLNEWLAEVVPDLRAGPGAKQPAVAKEIAYTMKFVITKEGSIMPSWSLTRSNGHIFRPNFKIGGARKKTHELIITLNAPEKETTDKTIRTDANGNIVQRLVTVTNFEDFLEKWKQIRDAEMREEQVKSAMTKIENRIVSETRSLLPDSQQLDFQVRESPAYENALERDREYQSLNKRLGALQRKIDGLKATVASPVVGAPSTSTAPIFPQELRHDQALTRQILRGDAFRN